MRHDRWGQMKLVCGEEKVYFVLCRLEQPRQDKNLLYWHDEPNEPTKEGPTLLVMVNVMKGGGRAPHPHQPGLILPSGWNVRQKAAVATLCTL
jgi:hypothetical protein